MIEASNERDVARFFSNAFIFSENMKSSGVEMYAMTRTIITECIQVPDFPKITFVNAKPKNERTNTKRKPMFVGIKKPTRIPCRRASRGILKVVFSIA